MRGLHELVDDRGVGGARKRLLPLRAELVPQRKLDAIRRTKPGGLTRERDTHTGGEINFFRGSGGYFFIKGGGRVRDIL